MIDVFYKIDKYSKQRIYYKRYKNGSVKSIDKITYDKFKRLQRKRGGGTDELPKLVNTCDDVTCIQEPTDEDLNTQLRNFFIFSSHNTYCTGAQVSKMNSPEVAVEPYIYLLERFRGGCYEIDTAEFNNTKTDLQVWHALPGNLNNVSGIVGLAGKNNPISFRNILTEIRAFVVSHQNPKCYPIILSIDMKKESFEAKKMISDICQELFEASDILWPGEKDKKNAYTEGVMLRDVMGKILIKNGSWNVEKDPRLLNVWLNSRMAFPADSRMKSMEDGNWSYNKTGKWEKRGSVYGLSILYEDPMYVRFYPKASEFESNNFSPIAHWTQWGVQMVALNMQTNDKYANMNTLVFYNKPFIVMNDDEIGRIHTICSIIDNVDFKENKVSYLTPYERCKNKVHSDRNSNSKIFLKSKLSCMEVEKGCSLDSCAIDQPPIRATMPANISVPAPNSLPITNEESAAEMQEISPQVLLANADEEGEGNIVENIGGSSSGKIRRHRQKRIHNNNI